MSRTRTGIIAVSIREMSRIRSRVIYLFILLILPIASFGLILSMFSAATPRNLPVAVLDNDFSALSRNLIRTINALPSIEVTEHVRSASQGKELMVQGKIFALIIIPKDFQNDVSRLRAPKVINYYNNQYLLIGGTIYKDIASAVRTLSIKANIQTRLKKGEVLQQAKVHAQPIEIQTHFMYNPNTNYLYYLAGSLLPTMLHLFVLLSTIYCFGIELKESTMADLFSTSGESIFRMIIGKLIPYFAVFAILAVFMNSIMFRYMGFPLRGNIPLVFTSTGLLIIAYQAVGIFFVAVTGHLRLALMGASFYASTAYTFIGMTFPIIAFPLPAKIWAYTLPLTHFMRIFIEQTIMGVSSRSSITPILILIAFAMLPLLVYPRIHSICTQSTYWGKI